MNRTCISSVLALVFASICIETALSNTALLIIDVQNCFLPGGGLAVADGQSVIPVINDIRRKYGDDFRLTVLSQDWHCAHHVSFASQHDNLNPYDEVDLLYDSQGHLCNGSCTAAHNVSQTLWPDHCIQGTDDAKFSSLLNVTDSDVIIQKGFLCHVDSYSAFYDNGGFTHTDLDSILKSHNIDTVVVTGLALDYCVYYTSKDAEKLGYKVYTVLDASRPVSNATMKTALQDLRQNGVHLIQSSDLAYVMTSSGALTSQLTTTALLIAVLYRFMVAMVNS